MARSSLAPLAAALLVAGCSLTIDPEKYAPAECPAGQKACGYKCVSVNDPGTGCGLPTCDACPGVAANSVAACGSDGQCSFACNPGWDDCANGPLDGCEARVDSALNCGACGRSCIGPCDPTAFVCTPSGALATGGEVKGIEQDSATGWTFVLVKPQLISGQLVFVPDITAPSVQVVASSLGYVSGLSLWGGSAWFGRSVGVSEVGHISSFSPPTALVTQDTLALPDVVYPGPAVDLVSGPSGTLWIPDVGAPLRFVPAGSPTGSVVFSGADFTSLAYEPVMGRYFIAESGQGGIIWTATSPASAAFTSIVDGAGRVTAMAAAQGGSGNYALYWVDAARGDVWRYDAISVRKDRIFAGRGPTSMDIAVDAAGDAYWTDSAAGTVTAWKSYGGFPRSAHVIGRSPAPGRIMVNAALVYWADDVDQLLRAVGK